MGTQFQPSGGGKRDRTADLLHAMQALSHLSYTPLRRRSIITAYTSSLQQINRKKPKNLMTAEITLNLVLPACSLLFPLLQERFVSFPQTHPENRKVLRLPPQDFLLPQYDRLAYRPFRRERTVSRPKRQTTASMDGVCSSPVNSRRNGIAT